MLGRKQKGKPTGKGRAGRSGQVVVACPRRHLSTTRDASYICPQCRKRYTTAAQVIHDLPKPTPTTPKAPPATKTTTAPAVANLTPTPFTLEA